MEHHDEFSARVGDFAADFTLPTLEGEVFSLRNLRGRWTVLFTWASW